MKYEKSSTLQHDTVHAVLMLLPLTSIKSCVLYMMCRAAST